MREQLEDLRDAVRAQTQAIGVLIEHLQQIESRLGRIELALTPEGPSPLEELLRGLLALGHEHSEQLAAIHAIVAKKAE